MLNILRKIIPARSPIRLLYHKLSAIVAAAYHRFPGHDMTIIAVTGTSGKSTTVELIQHILNKSGHKTGSLSSIRFHIGDEIFDNESLRTSLRPWHTQKWLKRMKNEKCEYVVLEISSHAIDQNRHWGIGIDTAVMTNVYDHEHLDYHKTFQHYLQTKLSLFTSLNLEYRKPDMAKTAILNADSEHFEAFNESPCDHIWSYSYKQASGFRADDINLSSKDIQFTLQIPNNVAQIEIPLIGLHNLENSLAAITTASAHKISLESITEALKSFPGAPARLEPINEGQDFSVLLDYTYKPSALKSVLQTLKDVSKGRLIVVWGGAGGRSEENWVAASEQLHLFADQIILTTDDPYDVDPRYIAKIVKENLPREEGELFFDIPDRYEAIQYALLTAKPEDTVLVAGRGHEKIQTIGKQKIEFEDKKVCQEILGLLLDKKPKTQEGIKDKQHEV